MNKLLHLQHSTPADILIKGANLAIAVEKFSSYNIQRQHTSQMSFSESN